MPLTYKKMILKALMEKCVAKSERGASMLTVRKYLAEHYSVADNSLSKTLIQKSMDELVAEKKVKKPTARSYRPCAWIAITHPGKKREPLKKKVAVARTTAKRAKKKAKTTTSKRKKARAKTRKAKKKKPKKTVKKKEVKKKKVIIKKLVSEKSVMIDGCLFDVQLTFIRRDPT